MGLFKEVKKNGYIETMANASRTQLSLLKVLNELQVEYEKSFREHQEVVDKLNKEIAALKLEILKAKGK